MPGIKPMNAIVHALLATAAAYAVPYEKRGMDQVISQCKHNFAYTFDDGPYKWNTDLVDTFEAVKAKTTFFVNGNNFDCIYSEANVNALRYAFERGHEIASHTWSHPHLTTLTEAQIDEEIGRLDEALVKILGVKPKMFRPPYGEIDEASALHIQNQHGKTIVLWDLDSGDTALGANKQGSIDFYDKLAKEGADSKHLPLSHEVWKYAVDAAKEHTVAALDKAKIKLLTVSQCLDMNPYEVVGQYGVRDDSWTCDGSWTGASTPTTTTTTTTTTTNTPTPTAPCKQTYTTAAKGETCSSIEAKFNLQDGTIKAANALLTCTDIWAGTPVCVPDGPYKSTGNGGSEPSCATQNYTSAAGDTCASIETKFALQAGAVAAANGGVNCADIWAGTNLALCVPTLAASDPQTCSKNVTAGAPTTCAAVGAANGVSAAWIKAWNAGINCADIWTGTSLCVAH